MRWISRSFFVNFFLIVISTAGAILILEYVLRFTSLTTNIIKPSMPQYYLRSDNQLGFDITPNFPTSTQVIRDRTFDIWSNERGCFDVPYKNEKPYFYLAGDSFTWGFAPYEDKWGTQLEMLLKMRVLKCGVGGFGTKQELMKTERDLETLSSPQLLILGYFYENDLEDDAFFPSKLVWDGHLIKKLDDRSLSFAEAQELLPRMYERGRKYCMGHEPKYPTVQRVKCFLTRNSIVYNLSKTGIKRLIPEQFLRGTGIVNEPPKGAGTITESDRITHYANITAFRDLARDKNTKLLVVLIPTYSDVIDETRSPHEKLKLFLTTQKIEYLDLLPEFREAYDARRIELYWRHDPHWNIAGNRLAGLLVARHIVSGSYGINDVRRKLELIEKKLREDYGIQ